jgi:FKBP-type peptidyl-prolyl cis-trans isomerase
MMDDFTPVDKIEKLGIEDRIEGTGAVVEAGDTVTCHYTGAVAKTGKVFQTSHDFGKAISFPLNGVIAGWTEGVPGMKVGGTRRLLIPAEQAYGSRPPYGSGIPADADLVFDIELVSIQGK